MLFPNLKARQIFGGGGAFRSGVQPPTGRGATGTIHTRESRGTEDRKQFERFIAGMLFPNLKAWQIFGGDGAFRSGVQPPTGRGPAQTGRGATGTIHTRESRGTEDRKQFERFIAGMLFPNLKARQIFGGGGSFRSGVQPPTGSNRLKLAQIGKDRQRPAQERQGGGAVRRIVL